MLVALLQVSTFPSWKGQALLSFRLPQRIQKVPRRAYAADRDEVAVSEEKTKDMALPLHGMQEREQYTMHGHFRVLKGLLRGAERIRVYMDQDSGLRAALLAAFAERIKARTADGWYVSVLKESTIHQKENAVQKAKLRLADAAKRFPGLPDGQLMVELMKEEMARAKALGQYDDQWLAHPVPNMSEPAKRGVLADRLRRLRPGSPGQAVPERQPARHRSLLHADPAPALHGRTVAGDGQQGPARVVRLLGLQAGEPHQDPGDLPGLLQLLQGGRRQEDSGDAAGASEGADQARGHPVLRRLGVAPQLGRR